MSHLNQLLESANPYKSLQSDAARLANKWNKTGLLEGISNETESNNMSMILENQAKQLVVENNQTGGPSVANFQAGTGANWAGIALPLVRKVFGQIAAKEFVSVQPMNLPSGLVFYLDFQYGTTKSGFTKGDSMYGTRLAENAPFGNTNAGGQYGAGRFGFSMNKATSIAQTEAWLTATAWETVTNWYTDLQADSSLKTAHAAGEIAKVTLLDVATNLPNYDEVAVKGFTLVDGAGAPLPGQYAQFTKLNGANLEFFVHTSGLVDATQYDIQYTVQTKDNNLGDFEDGNAGLIDNASNPINIPEINIQMESSAIVAKTRKLKAVWTPEFAQDLNAYHSLDAEAELTSIMSEYISLEIDMEILDMLIEAAPASQVEYWSAENNVVVDPVAGTSASSLGFYNSQGQWFQTLGTKMQKLSNTIHQKTFRGGANFMVCSPSVATVLESIPGFGTNSDGDVTKASYAFGVQKSGTINNRYTVYKNPYMTENTILMGFRGGQFLEAGAVFAPYIPLIMTPLVYDPTTFTPRKGLLTRYAKKVVRPEFYGKIFVSGLDTI
jgi:hypothetical protein